jgi:hypothetical protein
MDESGDPGVSGSPTPTYTVSGLFIHEAEWVPMLESLLRFRRYLRDSFGVRMRAEIKASEMIRGSGAWAGLGQGVQVRQRVYRSLCGSRPRMVQRWHSQS